MRSFSEFDPASPADSVARADAARLRSLAGWTYLLVRPGLEFVRQRSNFIQGWQAAAAAGSSVADGATAGAVGSADTPPLGSWMILPDLTSPATRTVLPSHDALYGVSHLELDLLGPVVVSVPANIDRRYFSVAVMDAHFNNVAHLGPKWTGHDAYCCLVAPPGWRGTAPDGMDVIVSPTVSVCLYNRMLVLDAPGDIDRVRAWQAGLANTQLAHWGEAEPVLDEVPLDAFVHPEINVLTDPFAYLALGLDHLTRNPLVTKASWLAALAEGAGFAEAASTAELSQAVSDGVDDATGMLDAALTTWSRGNGWMLPDPRLGKPNPLVLESAAFQQFQIGSNDIAEAGYYFCDTDADGAVLDASDEARFELRFTRASLPPIADGGYWSLTMYDEHSFLVANPDERYAVRPDNPGFVVEADGSIVVTLAAALPAGVPEANWLPAPRGRFRLGLRAYYPEGAILEGTWAPPAVTKVAPATPAPRDLPVQGRGESAS